MRWSRISRVELPVLRRACTRSSWLVARLYRDLADLERGIRLAELDLIGPRIDDKQEVALTHDLPVFKVDLGERAADLGAQLDLIDGRELADRSEARFDVALQGVADGHRRERSRRGTEAWEASWLK